MDKDNRDLKLPLPNDSSYFVKKPEKNEFEKLMNEAWWIQIYVAKAIWRDELPLAKCMFDEILMDCIIKLLSYYIGLNYNWNINIGKCGKWLRRYLTVDIYNEFKALYPSADYKEIGKCIFLYGSFLRKIGKDVSEKLGYDYPDKEDGSVTEFLIRIKNLPKNAEDF